MNDISRELISAITELIRQNCDAEKIVLYGSSARGDMSRSSDIDIALFGVPVSQLGLIRLELAENLPSLRDVDVQAFESIRNENLRKRILEEGIIVYERSSQ